MSTNIFAFPSDIKGSLDRELRDPDFRGSSTKSCSQFLPSQKKSTLVQKQKKQKQNESIFKTSCSSIILVMSRNCHRPKKKFKKKTL